MKLPPNYTYVGNLDKFERFIHLEDENLVLLVPIVKTFFGCVILAPWDFHGLLCQGELHKGRFSNRTMELTDRQKKLINEINEKIYISKSN